MFDMRRIDDTVFLAEGARVVLDVTIGEHSSVWYNAVIRGIPPQISIGKYSNVQDCVVMHASPGLPVVVGDYVTIGHSAIIHGCRIGDNTLIGMGSTIMNGAEIGRNCIIGAGSLVTQNTVIPDNSLAFGRPAKIIRTVSPEETVQNHMSAVHYAETAELLRNGKLS